MYAVVRIAGKQIEVRPNERYRVPRLSVAIGSSVEFDEVLLVSSDDSCQVGTPLVKGAKVKAEVLDHGRDKKIVVFHKKRRKDFSKKNGHRQPFSEIRVADIELP